MKRILAFCFHPAFTPPSSGGEARIFHFYSSLSRYFHITLITSTHGDTQEEVVQHGIRFTERRIPKDATFINQWQALEPHSSGGDLSGPCIAASANIHGAIHEAYLQAYPDADLIIHEFPFMVGYDLFLGTDHKPRIYNAHNCETQLYASLHPASDSTPIHNIVREAEQCLLLQADLLFYCNPGDLDRFTHIAPKAHYESVFIPHGAALQMPPSNQTAPGPLKTVFMGSAHPPNIDAVRHIVKVIAPSLPEVQFHILGNCLPEDASTDLPSNIKRHGFVTEAHKRELLHSSDLALNPMSSGSGANIKVLDYIAHGLPVISTPFGLRGMPMDVEHCSIAAELDGFVAAIRHLADNIGERQQLREATTATSNPLTWQASADTAANAISSWLAEAGTRTPMAPVLVLNDYDSFSGYGGGATRTQGLYSAVSTWAPVVFIHFNATQQWSNREVSPGIRTIGVPRTQEHVDSDRASAGMSHVSVLDIVAGLHAAHNPWLIAIYRGLRKQARCIVLEHCYLIDLPYLHGDRFVYSSQNHELVLKRTLLQGHPQQDTLLAFVEHAEQRALCASAAIIAVSDTDAGSFTQCVRAMAPAVVIANGANVPHFQDRGLAQQLPPPAPANIPVERTVIFLGSGHMPNVEAAHFISRQLAPGNPDIHFVFIGSVCDSIAQLPNIHLLGCLGSLEKDAIMQTCQVALNPVLSGSGSNVKLADYLGNGLYVISTEFGTRGYPSDIDAHVSITSPEAFATAIRRALAEPTLHTAQRRAERRRLYEDKLSMAVTGQYFQQTLQSLERPRKRVLYVAYRYTAPPLGGAEHNMEQFIRALSQSGQFDVDVVAPDITGIHSWHRFSEHYSRDGSYGVPVDIPHVRYAKFASTSPDATAIWSCLQVAWQAQITIEQALCQSLLDCQEKRDKTESILTWGWAPPEVRYGHKGRWLYTDAGLYVGRCSTLRLQGHSSQRCTICIFDERQRASITHIIPPGDFDIAWKLPTPGCMQLRTSAPAHEGDPRPLAMFVHSIQVDDVPMEMAAPTLIDRLKTIPAETIIDLFDAHALRIREEQGIQLCDIRGPWSHSLENYLIEHVQEYDLVIAHNPVFRPAVVAMREAQRKGIPSILVPHAHLDDDFYHFPDQIQAAQNASMVLAAPKAAVAYFQRKNCRTMYMPAGCDATENFSQADGFAFRAIYPDETPYFLVLGRKAGAKQYQKIINAIDQLNCQGRTVRLVMIGPDDDGLLIQSSNVTYLGRQPRNILRGAIMHCLAVCNMSSSESFGIVLLEAWLGGKPVVANRECAAFNDLAEHEHNALLVDTDTLAPTLVRILDEPELAARLAEQGRVVAQDFDWRHICDRFISVCHELTST